MCPLKMINIFICESLEQVNDRIAQVEASTFVKYVVYTMDKGFTEDWKPQFKNKVYWEWLQGRDSPCIPFDGVPFMFIGHKVMGCHRGPEKDQTKKQRYIEARDKETSEDQKGKKGRRVHLIKTKKLSCPAKVVVTRIAKFDGFKLDTERARAKKAKSKVIRQELQQDPASVEWKNLYYVRVPNASDHVGHPIGEGADDVDERVRDFIRSMVKQGVTRVPEMKAHMVQYVQTELFKDTEAPPLRKYFPTEKTIRGIITQTRIEENFCRIDLANLLSLSDSWREEAPKTSFLLRVQSESENLLLCYQTEWQQYLLRLYGQDVFFLDAAYKRARFPLPLYFLCVRTSVSLAAVGLFVVQSKSPEALKEALGVFRQWNPAWSPAYVVMEDCPVEMEAAETVFTDCLAVYNDYLRERTWTGWLGNRSRGITDQEEVFEMMRVIAGAMTMIHHQMAVTQLQESPIWTRSPLFRNWFTTKWLSHDKRWARAVRADAVNLVSVMNGGMEIQSGFFSHQDLKIHKSSSLSHMLRFLVDELFPQMHQKYFDLNSQSSTEFTINLVTPRFLWHRPHSVVSWVMEKMDAAVQCPSPEVEVVGGGKFRVQSASEEEEAAGLRSHAYAVSFGTEVSLPSCECEAWRGQMLPCEHFCQVFRLLPEWSWEQLCPQYKDHPLLALHISPLCEVEGAVAQLLDPASPPEPCPDRDGPEVVVPSTPTVPQAHTPAATPRVHLDAPVLLLTPATPDQRATPVAQVLTGEQVVIRREELQEECLSRLQCIMEDTRSITDLEHLQELRQRVAALQSHTHRMALGPAQPEVSSAGGRGRRRKRAGVEIVVAMPKHVKVPRIEDENVQK